MSKRVKRPNRSDDGSVPVKRRKRPATTQEAQEEEASALASWRPLNDLKIYNRTTTEAPAELFRKDLISAMKLPDSEPLALNEYWVIVDQWKQEWERGVQVPVNPDSLPEPSVTVTHCASVHVKPLQEFKPPKTKYIRITKDDNFKSEEHMLSTAPAQAEAACSYDLDECDVSWLKLVNSERLAAGSGPVTEDQLERVIERLELRCWDKIQAILRNEEGLGIEYDENVICDVCRSPDSEEGNEMVFCDSCNICVHQACYGITRIPEGQWLCCTCTIATRPECVLCPNKGGAMKCTRSGQKWAHVSCALWIPEVSIGCVEKMEPITKISSIPQSRWALICVLCRERVGACIQCSVKTCKTAYHVTCAFKHGLEMRAIIEDEHADDGVKLRSYCEKHSKSGKKEKSVCSGSEDDDCKRKKRKDMTSEEKNLARAARLCEIEAEFYKHVSAKDIAVHIEVDSEAVQYIYNYWKLKRKAGHNKPLLPPKSEDVDMLSHKQEQADLEKMKMFVQLRQDLERVRNLCYMVSRREKLSRTLFRMREQTFYKQVAVLETAGTSLAPTVIDAVIEANHGPSIYDQLYSHNEADDSSVHFETILARIAGIKSPPTPDSADEKKPELNGLFKDVKNNPYKKLYFNGSSKRRSGSLYGSGMSSASSSDERPKDNKENHLLTTTDEEKPSPSFLNKKKSTPNKKSLGNKTAERRKKRLSITHSKIDSSSEEDIKPTKKDWQMSKSRLKQIESELGMSASDSDELVPIKSTSQSDRKAISSIYSDSDSSDVSMKKDDDKSSAASDSQSQSRLRTKAAVKEFSNKPSTSKSPNKSSPENKKKTKESESPKKDSLKKKDSDLIVPQRQAAKKASENLKTNTTTNRTIKDPQTVSEPDMKSPEREKEEKLEKVVKTKAKGRPPKDMPKDKEEIKIKEHKEHKEEKIHKKEKELKAKEVDVFDIDKELDKSETDILAYVPQRQAAKKAAEHIKSGLGNKPAAGAGGPTADVTIIDDKIKTKDDKEEKKKEKEDISSKINKKEIESKKEFETKTKEPVKISNKETVKLSSKEPIKISSKEPAKIANKEHVKIANKEQVKMANKEQVKIANKEPVKIANKEPNKIVNKEPIKIANKEPNKIANKEPNKIANKEPVKIANRDSVKIANRESVKIANKEPVKTSTKEPIKTSSKETAKMSSKEPIKPIESNKQKSSSNSSTSSSSSSSSDSSSSSSSESEDEKPRAKEPQSESSFSPREQTKRTGTKDWPFLDKAAKSAASTSSSDSSDSSRPSSPRPQPKNNEQKESRPPAPIPPPLPTTIPQNARTKSEQKQPQQQAARAAPNKSSRKSADKKQPAPPEREEPVRVRGKGRSARGRSRPSNSGDRLRDVNVRSGDIPDRSPVERERATKTRNRKSDDSPAVVEQPKERVSKSPTKLLSPVRKTEKKLIEKVPEPELGNLEKEIMERKAASNKTTIDKIFGTPLEEKVEKIVKSPEKVHKSPVKENKEPTKQPSPLKKSPVKAKSIEDIFANILSSKTSKSPESRNFKKKTINHIKPIEDEVIILEDSCKIDLDAYETERDIIKHQEENRSLDKSIQSRSIFSPNPEGKDADILADIDNILDDGFNISKEDDFGMSKSDDSIKGPLTFPTVPSFFKEDSKEDSARETMNLVEKLRMGYSKKSSVYDVDDSVSVTSSTKNDSDKLEFAEQIISNNVLDTSQHDELTIQPQINLEMRVEVTDTKYDERKDYKYMNSNVMPLLEENKNVPEIQHHSNTRAQADERWVPPSDNYPNLQSADPKAYSMDLHLPEVPSYLQSYDRQNSHFNALQQDKLHDDFTKNHSPQSINSMHDRRITQTPFLDPASMDCMPSPSPYADIHPQAKWAESQIMPARRSSTSSQASSISMSSRRNDMDDEAMKRQEMMLMNHAALEMSFASQNMQFQQNSHDFPPFSDDASQFVSIPVSLFPPPSINTQLPFPSPGAAMFPPSFGAPFPTPHSVIPPLPKPVDDSMHFSSACTAAFTSSQHNMALTAAMVNLPPAPPPTPKEDVIEAQPIIAPIAPTPAPAPVEEVPASPALSNSTPNHVEPSPNPSLKSNSSVGKKSPSKPTRTSARFISQQSKSPSKSPGKSPMQEPVKAPAGRGRDNKKSAKASSGRGTQSQARGRGRGRGRGRTTHSQHEPDYPNTIHNKLVGTVYDLDFDDDMSNEMGDLRTMRERRKSSDIRDLKPVTPYITRDSSESPKFTSPTHKGRSYKADLCDLRPPTPISEGQSKTASPEPPIVETKTFPTIVPPVLPGPVDMRTYNNTTFDTQQYNEANLLGAFGTGAAEQPAHEELDENFEKELHSALTASLIKPDEPHVPEVSNIKVSLSDSRNQLKVKIKGPIANYTSTVIPMAPINDIVVPLIVPPITVSNNAITNISMNINSGTSTNLRRMRKKELLRQYWTQDMNMDDPTNTPVYAVVPAAPSINRTIISIPKAVASMTTIPTKDDYRDYRIGSDDLWGEPAKIRKEKKPGLCRELRQLDITLLDDDSMERRRSIGSNSNSGLSSFDISNKRRGRPPRPLQTTPKLKIKISSNSIVSGSKIDEKMKDRIRPPKKRSTATISKPSIEDLKRESMKFRKLVMAGFGEEKERKEKKKKDRSGRKSKKKKKQEVQIIENDGTNSAPKLIIRLAKSDKSSSSSVIEASGDKDLVRTSNKNSDRTTESADQGANPGSTSALRMVRTNKVMPLKLKLSRCQEGSGYVMKTPPPEEEKPPPAPPPPTLAPSSLTSKSNVPATLNLTEPPPPVHTATPLPLNKDCEVR